MILPDRGGPFVRLPRSPSKGHSLPYQIHRTPPATPVICHDTTSHVPHVRAGFGRWACGMTAMCYRDGGHPRRGGDSFEFFEAAQATLAKFSINRLCNNLKAYDQHPGGSGWLRHAYAPGRSNSCSPVESSKAKVSRIPG